MNGLINIIHKYFPLDDMNLHIKQIRNRANMSSID